MQEEKEGFKVTADGHFNMENKNIHNSGKPREINDAVPLNYIQANCLVSSCRSVEVRGKKLTKVKGSIEYTDAANRNFVDSNCLHYTKMGKNNVIDARGHRKISSIAARRSTDAVNKQYVDSKSLLLTDDDGYLTV